MMAVSTTGLSGESTRRDVLSLGAAAPEVLSVEGPGGVGGEGCCR